MTKKLRVVIAQLNLLVGDIEGNLKKHVQAAETARDLFKADVIVFPELSLTGYPPEDLLLRKAFIDEAVQALHRFKEAIADIYCIVGHPYPIEQGLLNACSLIYNGTLLGRRGKQHLPNYAIFDECRYFVPDATPCVLPIRGVPVGLVICEDLWAPGPVHQAATLGARLILSPNASPFEIHKHESRVAILYQRAKSNRVPIIYVNQYGAQDEIIHDGGSMVVDEEGCVRQLVGFNMEALHPVNVRISSTETTIDPIPYHLPSEEEKIYNALVLGVRDYIEKNHFPGVMVAISGGIDSALTLAIAVDALGSERVEAVFMPSRYSADISQEDAIACARQLQVPLQTISIEPVYQSFLDTLASSFSEKKADIAEENIQSRCRAVIMMALSNNNGKIVLTTGTRSELAVGYTTIYGDMAGGYAVLKDVPKTMVFRLAHYRNQRSPVIPPRSITRPPSAELAPNQKDEDSLPPYEMLDQILELYLDQEKSKEEIINQGFDKATVLRVVQLIQRNEYKRHQTPVGTRLNFKAFGKDRRYPITSGFKG